MESKTYIIFFFFYSILLIINIFDKRWDDFDFYFDFKKRRRKSDIDYLFKLIHIHNEIFNKYDLIYLES